MLKSLGNRSLKALIIDEAAQCVEPEILIPFQLDPKHVVFVGDTKQLPATVKSDEAKKKGYDQSIMSRLLKNECKVLMLEEQYRMHPDICRFSNNEFYDGRLVTHYTPRSFPVLEGTILSKPCIFYNIKSGSESKAGKSFKNKSEANHVLNIIKSIQNNPLHDDETIGIITFYNGQVDLIKNKLKASNIDFNNVDSRVRVHTVDGFQGDECDIIIISCVRSKNTVGFLKDERRLNVALTRAKHNRIILGNVDTLCIKKSTKRVVIDAVENDELFGERDLPDMSVTLKKKKKKKKRKARKKSS